MHFNNTSILKTVYFESILIHLQQYISSCKDTAEDESK